MNEIAESETIISKCLTEEIKLPNIDENTEEDKVIKHNQNKKIGISVNRKYH